MITNPRNQEITTSQKSFRTPIFVETFPVTLSINEPNDTIPLALNSGLSSDNLGTFSESGFIGDNPNVPPTDEVDIIEFQLDAGDIAIIDIDASEFGSSLDPILRLFDSEGNEVAVNDDSDGLDSFLDFTAPVSDNYFVGVSSFSNFDYDPFVEGSGSGGSTGDYELEISILESLSPLTNDSLTVDIREVNGAIDTVLFGGSDFFNPGSPISDFGLQNGTDTSTFVLNTTTGLNQQPVSVTSTDGEIIVTGTYTEGGADVDFTRTYSLVEGLNVLKVETEFVNNGSDLTLNYFDTFDPDQGIDQGTGFGTFNDVLPLPIALGPVTVGQATESNGLTVAIGSLDAEITVASGSPFNIGDGFTLNDFLASPFDGDGTFDDQGTHIGVQLELEAGESESFEYFQAYGETIEEAQEQLILATFNVIEGTSNNNSILGSSDNDFISGLAGNDNILGNAGDDVIVGGEGNDRLLGNLGADILDGGADNDILISGSGDDILDGGRGNDTLIAGSGNDQFVLREGDGEDSIADYLDGTDSFLLDGGLTFEDLTITQGIGLSVISIMDTNEELASLIGVNANDLGVEDFSTLDF